MTTTLNAVPKTVQLADIENKQILIENQEYSANDDEIDITFKDLFYSVQVKELDGTSRQRVILDKVNGICKSGEMTAILGSSGAGKTSLLNILACRIESDKNVKLEGKILANNLEYTFLDFPDFATYVMQDDRLMETLTVRECLQFGADLKMKGTQIEKNQRVNNILRLMRLERAQDTPIGGQFMKGVSGGERKRTSIGFEIMCEPQDSFTAYLLILVLSRYARKRKTVILTIHMPSADIWNLFDRIMLLVDGHFIYQGKSQADIINYFSNMGFTCPVNSNPADYFMSIMHRESAQNQNNYKTYYKTYEEQLQPRVLQDIEMHRQHKIKKRQTQNNFMYEMSKVAGRTYLNMKRNPIIYKARITQTIFLGLFVGFVFFQLSDGYNGQSQNIQAANNKEGFLFFTTVDQFMMSMHIAVLTFPSERNVFLKEINMRMYGLGSYFMGKTMPELPLQAIGPAIYQLISYWLVGLNSSNASFFWIQYLTALLLSLCGNSLGLLVGTYFPDGKSAISMLPLFFLPFMLFGGFFVNNKSYQVWIGWLQYLSPFKYGFEAMAIDQFRNTGFTPNPIQTLGLTLGMWQSIGVLVGLFFAFRIMAFFYLWKNTKRLQ